MVQLVAARHRVRPTLGIAVLAIVLSGIGDARAAEDTTAATLTGSALIGGDAARPAVGASIVVLRTGQPPVRTTVDPTTGAFTLTLDSGAYRVSLASPPISITSPNWVNTTSAQAVTVPSAAPLAFAPAAADGTITGTIVGPGGETTFQDGSRAWVRATNQEGQGNTVQVDPATGAFSVRVLSGNTRLHVTLENRLWAAPDTLAGAIFFVEPTAPYPVGTVNLQIKSASVTGTVKLISGAPLTGVSVPVRAWRLDGSDVDVAASSAATGSYTLALTPGVWEVRAVPEAASGYVAAQSPRRITVINNAAVIFDPLVAVADVTINGTIVDASGTPITGLTGTAYARWRDGVRGDVSQGARIIDGRFTLRLASSVATTYTVRALLSPDSGYTAAAPAQIVVAAGQTRPLSIPAVADNATISGTLRNQATANPQPGLAGMIFAGSNTGGRARARVNPLTARYSLAVASSAESGQGGSTWLVRAFVDLTNGFVVQRPRAQTVFLPYNNGAGADVTLDFNVARINTVIEGRVFNADGSPARGAKVSLRQTTPDAADAYTRWVLTGANGRYRIAAPVGTFAITAHLRDAAPPLPVQVSTSANTTTIAADLRLRARDATISGQVTIDGAAIPAFVRATSASGGRALAVTDLSGNYTLRVSSGDLWRVQAVAERVVTDAGASTTQFLQSVRVAITPAVGANTDNALVLAVVDTLPAALALTFDAAEEQALTLADGAQLLIPAGAMTESGQLTVAVRPLVALAADSGAQPVRFGYRLLAFDSMRRPIVRFRAPVTVVLPFTAAQLTALGVTPAQLVPAYWDEASESWKPEEQVTVEVFSNGDGVVRAEVEHFTDYALLASPTSRVYLPLAAR